jgi:hypothetical protein
MPETLPPIEYPSTDIVRKVDVNGNISFRNRPCAGLPVAIRPTTTSSLFAVFFCHQKLMDLELQ